MTKNITGIDVSQEKLDIYSAINDKFDQFTNDNAGINRLVKHLKKINVDMVIFEPTNKFHRLLESKLSEANIKFYRVSPLKLRHFAKSKGQYAKTDRTDAKILALYGQGLDGETSQPINPIIAILQEKQHFLQALIADRTAALNRLNTLLDKDSKDLCQKQIAHLDKLISDMEKQIIALIKSDKDLHHRYQIIISIKGVGNKCAFALLADLPELGECDSKQIAALVGIAPINRQSGKWTGKSFIGGGRKHCRNALYMPAVSAVRFNPIFKHKYQSLIALGKPHKVAITAIMRKLIVIINSLIKNNKKFITLCA